ncbi:unnamed protein product [Enterobius vermicularis]|uniref:Nuclear receptor domain-containing protein n=1 Tax=Enterobius vermicularis TaxID=51028 RepID=A0A0N4VQ44_ENTVE|nr:unnamed protein product [Enterobius vermicularis]
MSSQSVELCLVCQDVSTGYHYGVPSCNGCKTFFRRTIVKKQTFVCQHDGKCPVDKSIRCSCRSCRFKKCLEVGMDRFAIQQSRDPIGYTKRTRRYSVLKAVHTPEGDQSSPQSDIKDVRAQTSEYDSQDEFLDALTDVEEKCKKLRNAEIQINCGKGLLENQKNSLVLRPAQLIDYQSWHENDWILMTEWAKSIPAYQSLPISDKLALLRHSALTFPHLSQCFYSEDHGPDTLVFPSGAYMDRTSEPGRSLGFGRRKHQMLDQLLIPMRKMKVDLCEFAAFKAIFFLNPGQFKISSTEAFLLLFLDAEDISETSKKLISEGRSLVTSALYKYIIKKTGFEDSGDRFRKLLLLGTVLATMAVELKEAVVAANFFNQLEFSSFAKQLLFGLKSEV